MGVHSNYNPNRSPKIRSPKNHQVVEAKVTTVRKRKRGRPKEIKTILWEQERRAGNIRLQEKLRRKRAEIFRNRPDVQRLQKRQRTLYTLPTPAIVLKWEGELPRKVVVKAKPPKRFMVKAEPVDLEFAKILLAIATRS